MAVAVAGVGAFSTATTTSPSVSLPAGIVAGDLLLIECEFQTNSNDDPSATGWTLIFASGSQAAATGITRLNVYGRIADGTEGTSVTFSLGAATTDNHFAARSFRITGHGVTTVSTDIVVGARGNGAAGTSPQTNTIPGITVSANSLVVMLAGTALDLAWTNAQFSSWTNANLTGITEYADDGTSSGNGGGVGMAAGTATAGGAIGSSTYAQATAEAWNAVQIGIPPAGSGTTYTDSPSGTITLSGSIVESYSHDDAPSGTIILSGSPSETASFSDTQSGTIALSGSITESWGTSTSYNDSPTGTITLSGSLVESHSVSTTPSGTISLSGALPESDVYSDAKFGAITLSGSLVESWTVTDHLSGTIQLAGAIVEAHSNSDFLLTPTATSTLTAVGDSSSTTLTLTPQAEDSESLTAASDGAFTLTPATPGP